MDKDKNALKEAKYNYLQKMMICSDSEDEHGDGMNQNDIIKFLEADYREVLKRKDHLINQLNREKINLSQFSHETLQDEDNENLKVLKELKDLTMVKIKKQINNKLQGSNFKAFLSE